MAHSSSRRTRGFYYPGYIFVDPGRDRWIREHSSFASKKWIISTVRYGEWVFRHDGAFEVFVKVPQPRKVLTIVLVCRHWRRGGPHFSDRNYVHVFGSHILRKKTR